MFILLLFYRLLENKWKSKSILLSASKLHAIIVNIFYHRNVLSQNILFLRAPQKIVPKERK